MSRNCLRSITIESSRVTVSATATDVDSGIAKIELYDGTKLIGQGTGTALSVQYNLRKAGKGAHVFKAKAYDKAGNISEAMANVTIN